MATSIFYKKVNEAIAEMKEKENQEVWIWVEGYKGTDRDMKCRDYQFYLNKQFDIPADQKVEDCKSGFHLCLYLKDVFSYYGIGKGNRFFRVRALVRRTDFEEYCLGDNPNNLAIMPINSTSRATPRTKHRDKLAARSIQFLYEMTADEVLRVYPKLEGGELDGWSEEVKKVAIEVHVDKAREIVRTQDLVELGYSGPFANFIVYEDGYELAKAVGSQPDMSMDMKALFILEGLRNKNANRNAMAGMSASAINACYQALANSSGISNLRRG